MYSDVNWSKHVEFFLWKENIYSFSFFAARFQCTIFPFLLPHELHTNKFCIVTTRTLLWMVASTKSECKKDFCKQQVWVVCERKKFFFLIFVLSGEQERLLGICSCKNILNAHTLSDRTKYEGNFLFVNALMNSAFLINISGGFHKLCIKFVFRSFDVLT